VNTVKRVEQHIISKNDPRFAALDAAAFASKNLYNAALYEVRQSFIHQGKYLNYQEMDRRMKQHEAYKALPAKVSQQILMVLNRNWKSFFAALKAYEEDPSPFLGRPKLPKYKNKTESRKILVYTIQAIRKIRLEQGCIQPSMLPISVKTNQTSIVQVRIVPRNGYYVIEVVYEKDIVQADVHPELCAGIDIGVNNLATITSNKVGFVPCIVNGRPVKSINSSITSVEQRYKRNLAPQEPRNAWNA